MRRLRYGEVILRVPISTNQYKKVIVRVQDPDALQINDSVIVCAKRTAYEGYVYRIGGRR
jgi:hypothetical protein